MSRKNKSKTRVKRWFKCAKCGELIDPKTRVDMCREGKLTRVHFSCLYAPQSDVTLGGKAEPSTPSEPKEEQ